MTTTSTISETTRVSPLRLSAPVSVCDDEPRTPGDWSATGPRWIERCLLAIILFEIPIQLDIYLSYDYALAELGAIGGLNVSITTFCLALLFALRLPRVAVEGVPSRSTFVRLIRSPGFFFVVLAMSIMVASSPRLAMNEIVLVGQAFALYCYVAMFTRTRGDVVFIVGVMLIALLLQSVAIVGVWHLGHGFNLGPLHFRVDDSGRVGGTVGSPNGAAAYLSLLLPLSAALVARGIPPVLKVLAGMAFAVTVPALIATSSRGGWVAGCVALSLVMAVNVHRHRVRLRTVVLSILVALVGFGLFWSSISARLFESDHGAAKSRIPLLQIAGQIIADHPVLGVGANNYVIASRPYSTTSRYRGSWDYVVHNKYMLVWAETGTAGLGAFLLFLAGAVRHGVHAARGSSAIVASVAVGLTAGIAGHSVHMLFDTFHGRPAVQMLWLGAGLLAAVANLSPSATSQPLLARAKVGPMIRREIVQCN